MTMHAPRTELVRVGEAHCLFRPDNHAAALLNTAAASLCSDILDRAARGDLDAGNAEFEAALTAQLAAAGFLDRIAEPSAASVVVLDTIQPVAGAPLLLSFRNGPCVGVYCDDADLKPLLNAALAPLRLGTKAKPDVRLDVRGSDYNYQIDRDGDAIASDVPLHVARRVVLQATLMALFEPGMVATILHASSVSLDGRAIVLAGATGSGKSTLTMSLVAAGFGYIADDLTALDDKGERVSTFPVAASIKSGSWPMAGELFPRLLECETHQAGTRSVRYLDLVHHAAPADATPVGAIVFPQYRPDEPQSAERLTPEAALGQLLQTGSEIVGAERSMQPLATLVNTTPAWHLNYSDIRWAEAQIRNMATAA